MLEIINNHGLTVYLLSMITGSSINTIRKYMKELNIPRSDKPAFCVG